MKRSHTQGRRAALLGALVTLVGIGTAWGHHSGAMFDRSKPTELKGVVQEWRWVNPHVFLKLNVTGADGKTTLWILEGREVRYYVEQGLKRTSFKPGDTVTVAIAPLKDGDPGGYINGVIFADGTRWGQIKGAG